MTKLIFCDYWLDNKQVFYNDKDVQWWHIKRIDICVNNQDIEKFKQLPFNKARCIIDNVLNDIVVVLKS